LIGDDVDGGGKAHQRALVLIGRTGRCLDHVECARVFFRRIDVTAQAEPRGGERQHASELAAAENADGRAGFEQVQSLGFLETALVCRARQASSRLAILASDSASTAAASRAALIAPGLPMASVPTGTPPGICMIESSESLPSSACVFIGTPNTGSGVIAAVIPGKCAAPPAPAMMTLTPALRAPWANSNSRAGVRCAETISASWPILSALSVSAACFIVAQSDWLPMMIATGFAAISLPLALRQAGFGERKRRIIGWH